MYGFGDSYLAPFALLLRAGNRAMAFLGTAPLVIGAVAQMAGAALTERWGRRKALLVATTAAQAVVWQLLFWVPFLFRDRAVGATLLLGSVLAWLGSFGSPAWTSWMGDVTQPEQRGRFFAVRNSVLTIVTLAAMLSAAALASFWRAYGRPWVGFGCLFTIAALARAVSSWLLSRHIEPPLRRDPDAYFSFWDFLRRLPRSNFARFSLAVAMMNGAVNVAGPFFSVYMLRDLGWSYWQFTLNTIVFLVAQFVIYRWWGAICDRHGARVVVKATSLVLPILPLLWASITDFWGLMAAQALSGFTWSGFNLATTNFIYDAVTPPKRARVVSYHGLLNAVFTLAGANLLGATLADLVPGEFQLGLWHVRLTSSLPVVFVASAILRALAAAFMLPRFREVRPVEKIRTLELLWRFGRGEPILYAGQELMHRFPLRPRREEPPAAPPPL